MKSAGCAGLTQLQKKCLQHLHDMISRHYHFVTKDETEPSLPPFFLGGGDYRVFCLEFAKYLNF